MRTHSVLKRVIIPYSVALTPLVLTGAMRRLRTRDIETAIDVLLQELDCRSGDPDVEPDPDLEAEPDDEIS
jgi:hypothetical protein